LNRVGGMGGGKGTEGIEVFWEGKDRCCEWLVDLMVRFIPIAILALAHHLPLHPPPTILPHHPTPTYRWMCPTAAAEFKCSNQRIHSTCETTTRGPMKGRIKVRTLRPSSWAIGLLRKEPFEWRLPLSPRRRRRALTAPHPKKNTKHPIHGDIAQYAREDMVESVQAS
jgi:hypothetical protein